MSALTEKEILKRIYTIRGKRVMLDRDLAELYGVETKVLNQAVKRNKDRFPEDFMIALNEKEYELLRSQIVTSNTGRDGRRYLPFVFTEQGIAMLSTVLSSKTAIKVNIQIMRPFVQMREMLASTKGMVNKIEKMEKKLLKQGKVLKQHSKQIKMIFSAIKELLIPQEKPARKIGFRMSHIRVGKHANLNSPQVLGA